MPVVPINLKGWVMGYRADKKTYTRGLPGTHVHLVIHIADASGDHWFNPLVKGDMAKLKAYVKANPGNHLAKEALDAYNGQKDTFGPIPVDNRPGHEGEFEIPEVPVGDWCYEVTAIVEDHDGFKHTDEKGNDGRGGRNRINHRLVGPHPSLEGIVVPVEDRWYKLAPPGGEPDTEHFVPGLIK